VPPDRSEHTINYARANLRDAIRGLTGEREPDVVYDSVGGPYTEPAFRCIAWRGRYLVSGFTGCAISSLPLNLPLLKGTSLVGVFWAISTDANQPPARNLLWNWRSGTCRAR
jgi:NADPH2:quinone reductase